MKKRLREFHLAMIFFTRLPAVGLSGEPPSLGETVWAWPLIGFGLAASASLSYGIFTAIGVAPIIAGILMIFAVTVFTGALHEDGFADCADSFGAATPAKRLDIMKDSRIGTYGTIALLFVFTVRIACIVSIIDTQTSITVLFATLTCVHVVSRAILPVFALAFPPAKSEGLAAAMGSIHRAGTATGIVLAVPVIAVAGLYGGLAGTDIFLVAVLSVGAGFAFFWFMTRRLGGYTGDTLGGSQITAELTAWIILGSYFAG